MATSAGAVLAAMSTVPRWTTLGGFTVALRIA